MGIPYFSCIENPGELFVFIALGLVCSSVAAVGYLVLREIDKKPDTKTGIALAALIGFTWYIFAAWIFNGDSFEWSAAFGRWLQGQ